jgi:hypothetical protein
MTDIYDRTGARERVARLAPSDPVAALAIARKISGAWHRCQALAFVAQHLSDQKMRRNVLEEALKAADETAEPNRVVSVSAWPLNVALGIGLVEWFSKEMDRLLELLSSEPNAVKRQDALIVLVKQIVHMPDDQLSRILDMFTAASAEGHSWKIDYNLQWMAELLNERDHQAAVNLALMCKTPKGKRKALRAIGETELAESFGGSQPD